MSDNCKTGTVHPSRLFTSDIGQLGRRRHHVKALLECDVTDLQKIIRQKKEQGQTDLSFTAWMLRCMALALDEHREVHALPSGRRKLLVFDEVDISLMVEKKTGDKKVPVPFVLRGAQQKTVAQIWGEIEAVKQADMDRERQQYDHAKSIGSKLFLALPQRLRLVIWRLMLSNPRRVKKMMGTSLFTSVGMFGKVAGWAIPCSIHPVTFTLGAITPKPRYIDGMLAERSILHMTILVDHDVVDGAPAARFMAALNELIEHPKKLFAKISLCKKITAQEVFSHDQALGETNVRNQHHQAAAMVRNIRHAVCVCCMRVGGFCR